MLNPRSTFFLGVAALALAISGCGSEEGAESPFAPDDSGFTSRVVAFEPVDTDLVFAIDVSDSTDAAELGAVVDGLLAALADGEVFDQSGSASVAVVVYGDTTATVVDPLTVYDATSLTNVFTPALEALGSDRLVTGGGAVLDEALARAGELLAAGTSGNAHLFVIGGGQDADATAVGSACDVLVGAGVRVHAVGLAADETGSSVLSGCTDASGGYFQNAADVDAIAGAIRSVLSLVTVVQLRLDPDTASLDRGAEHTVTATVTRGVGDAAVPVAGWDVVFEVTSGPSVGVIDTLATGENGEVSFSLVGDVPPGTDTIEARIDHPDGDVTVRASVTVTWVNQAPNCDVGGPYTAMVDADTVRVALDASASTDAEGDALSFLWSVEGEGLSLVDADRAMAELVIAGGATCEESIEVVLTVSDGFDTSTCTVEVALTDMRMPTIVVKDTTVELWPVNHRMHRITPEMTLASVDDACSSMSIDDVTVLSVTSDERFDERGSGNTSPDVVIGCDGTVQLRAERAGGGDGRVYTIEYAVTDADGNTTTAAVEVHVPHDQSGRGAVAGQVMETVMADCEPMSR